MRGFFLRSGDGAQQGLSPLRNCTCVENAENFISSQVLWQSMT